MLLAANRQNWVEIASVFVSSVVGLVVGVIAWSLYQMELGGRRRAQ